MKLFSYKNRAMSAFAAALSLVFVLLSANFAQAAVTFSSTAVTSDGVLTLNGAAASANTLFAATDTGTITVGAGLTTGTYTLGNATQTGAVTLRGAVTGGANSLFGNTTTAAINIGNACTTCTITVGGGGANVITLGDVTGPTSGTTLIGGSITLNGAVNYGVDAGSTDDYVVTLSPAPTAYATGMIISFTVATANTTGATINVNGLGVKALVKGANAALATSDLIVGRTYLAVYDGTQFDVINPAAQ